MSRRAESWTRRRLAVQCIWLPCVALSIVSLQSCDSHRSDSSSTALPFLAFRAKHPDVAAVLSGATARSMERDLLRALPCLDSYRQRHADARLLRGALSLRLSIDERGFRITSVEPATGNIDQEVARCLQKAFAW